MQIDESDEQPWKADLPIDETLQPDSNVTIERDSHPAKQAVRRFSTDEGMQIDESDEQLWKADAPIHETLQPDSNVTAERDSR
jgi:hypothetical protein